jgi:hypothetical protein
MSMTPPFGIFGALSGPGVSETYRFATPDRPTARIEAVVPAGNGSKRPSSIWSDTSAWASGVSWMSETLPTSTPPISTRSPFTSWPASTKRA